MTLTSETKQIQAPLGLEGNTKSTMKLNKYVESLVQDTIQKEVQEKDNMRSQNAAAISAQATGKGALLDIII